MNVTNYGSSVKMPNMFTCALSHKYQTHFVTYRSTNDADDEERGVVSLSFVLYDYYYYPINYLQALLTDKTFFFPLPLFVQLFSSSRLLSCPLFAHRRPLNKCLRPYRNSCF